MIDLADIQAAAARIAGKVVRTPTIRSDALSRLTGAEVWLKLDTLQITGAFKERGAANRLALLTPEERHAGVVAMSAGNHAQAVARHAALLGIRAVIVMPAFAPITKVTRTAKWGAEVILHGASLSEAAAHARMLAEQQGLVFIHPYDDDAIIAGQGTLGLELIADVPDLDTLLVPVGGGGLIAGCAIAAAGAGRPIRTYGVEVESYAAMAQELAGEPVDVGGPTIAEGIAVRDVGRKPIEIARAHVARIFTVSETAIEDAIAYLAEEVKIVAEGAGAAGVAAILAHRDAFAGHVVGIPLCGANIDSRALANVLQRAMVRDGRIRRVMIDIADRPGVLGEISTRVGEAGASIIEVLHHRVFTTPNVQAARLELTFEARDATHSAAVLAALRAHYAVTEI